MDSPLSQVTLPSGDTVPALGLGTWRMGEHWHRRTTEIQALRMGFDLGMTLVDTAEMYGEGGAERIVGEAIAGRRDQIFLVTKIYPHHASTRVMPKACDDSLRRLRTEQIDLYLLHWRGETVLEEVVEGFVQTAARRQDSPLGRQQFRSRRYAGARSSVRRRIRLCESSPVQPRSPRNRAQRAALVHGTAYSNHGLLPGGSGASGQFLGAAGGERAIRRDAGANRLGLAACPGRGYCDPESDPRCTPPGKSQRQANVRLGKQELAELDAMFPPPK